MLLEWLNDNADVLCLFLQQSGINEAFHPLSVYILLASFTLINSFTLTVALLNVI